MKISHRNQSLEKPLPKTLYLAVAFFFLCEGVLWADLKEVLEDRDKNGSLETRAYYSAGEIFKTEADTNGDGKTDAWIRYKDGKRHRGEADTDHDGKIDAWLVYSDSGRLLQRSGDGNGDGKPDQFMSFLKNRQITMREFDRNFDGKIDRRGLLKWDADKSISIWNQNQMQKIPIPGYVMVWREDDNDYDGIIDDFKAKPDRVRGEDGNPIVTEIKSRNGMPMDPFPLQPIEDDSSEEPAVEPAPAAPSDGAAASADKPRSKIRLGIGTAGTSAERVRRMNERFGWDEKIEKIDPSA